MDLREIESYKAYKITSAKGKYKRYTGKIIVKMLSLIDGEIIIHMEGKAVVIKNKYIKNFEIEKC